MSISKRSVLYVEDHPVNAILMQALFDQRPQFDLIVATSGAEALRIARDLAPALLMLDLGLPDCHGSELLPALRQLPGCRQAPAVAVTADAFFDLSHSGFLETWMKPLDLEFVLERLDHVTGTAADVSFAHLPADAAATPWALRARIGGDLVGARLPN